MASRQVGWRSRGRGKGDGKGLEVCRWAWLWAGSSWVLSRLGAGRDDTGLLYSHH